MQFLLRNTPNMQIKYSGKYLTEANISYISGENILMDATKLRRTRTYPKH